jgi:hypothetical protein
MEKMFTHWYQIANLVPTDDLLKRRWQGIENFAGQASAKDILDLSRLFYQRRPKDSSFKDRLREVFRAEDSTFGMKDNDVELAVLCGACLLHLAKGVMEGKPAAHLAALAIICPSFQGKGVSGVVPAIETEARDRLVKRSARLRSMHLEECEDIELPSADGLSKIITTVSKGAGPWPDSGQQLIAWSKAVDDAISEICNRFQAIQEDMLLRREETDMLWWMTAGFSRDLDRPIAEIEFATACILVGKELGDLVRVLPGPYAARAVIHRMLLAGDSKAANTVSLKKAVNATGIEWRTNWIAQGMTAAAFDLCPVRFAVERSLESGDESSWVPALKGVTQVDATIEMSPTDLAFQVYQEMLFMKALREIAGGQ